MLIYTGTKKDFTTDCLNGVIEKKILDGFRQQSILLPGRREIESYKQSTMYMANILLVSEIDDEVEVALEYQIPSSSKRVDFIIGGVDGKGNENIVIVELKQWTYAEKTNLDAQVKTILAGSKRLTSHPSYQAYSYAKMIEDYNETVSNDEIIIKACAFLHNYEDKYKFELDNDFYKKYIEYAPIFFRTDAQKLISFIEKHVKKRSDGNLLYRLDNGKIKPSKSLQDVLSGLLKGNKEFQLLDEQKTVYEIALDLMSDSVKTSEKNVLIVEGGPGTGKTVIAINLLVELTQRNYITQYVTKNSAPRNVFLEKLIQGDFKKRYIENLFRPSGSYINYSPNEIDCLIVDESHRLNEKSGIFGNLGQNQIFEIINASKFSIFFIDEDQIVTTKDFGSINEIKRCAKKLGANVYHNAATMLVSQFRCNGSDGYLNWLDNLLEIRPTANYEFDFDYDFRVYDDPNELREELRKKNQINNKSRMLAGYCWEWDNKKRNDPNHYDIVIDEFDFQASWNLGNTNTFAIDKTSFEQIGCIHTSQGLEFDYVGVIIGKDLYYEGEKVQTDFTRRAKSDKSLWGIKKSKNYELADRIIRNTYKTLMTRGQKGCYIYVEDKNLSDYIKKALGERLS